jgi:hypothetical protein
MAKGHQTLVAINTCLPRKPEMKINDLENVYRIVS